MLPPLEKSREERLANALQAVLGTCSGRTAWQKKWPNVYAEARAALKEHEEAKLHAEHRGDAMARADARHMNKELYGMELP